MRQGGSSPLLFAENLRKMRGFLRVFAEKYGYFAENPQSKKTIIPFNINDITVKIGLICGKSGKNRESFSIQKSGFVLLLPQCACCCY